MTIQKGGTTQEAPNFQLGVLLVHGIGTQRSGETLVRWGDVLPKLWDAQRGKESRRPSSGRVLATAPERVASRRPCCSGRMIVPSAGYSPSAGGRTLFLPRATGSLCHGA